MRNLIAFGALPGRYSRLLRQRCIRVPDSTRGLWPRLVRFRPIAICMILGSLQPKQLWTLKFMGPYLSRYLSLAQRINCAITHYSFEGRHYGPTYRDRVHQSASGLVLWHRVLDGACYAVTLRATDDPRREGGLSVLCFVDDTPVYCMAFSYVNGRLFGLGSGRTMFVTRSQTNRNPELQRFRDTFKQNSPSYFCLAAVCGIAMANGMSNVVMIKHDAQISYDERYAEGFRNSYSALWEAFGAQEIEHRHAYIMSIPLNLNPLSGMKHRARAIARRRNWLEIALSTRQILLEDRTSRDPPPIKGEAHALLGANQDQACRLTPPALRRPLQGSERYYGANPQT